MLKKVLPQRLALWLWAPSCFSVAQKTAYQTTRGYGWLEITVAIVSLMAGIAIGLGCRLQRGDVGGESTTNAGRREHGCKKTASPPHGACNARAPPSSSRSSSKGTLTEFPLEDLSPLVCAVCLEVFDDPVMLTRCGHTLCRGCAEACRPRGCPVCRKPMGAVIPNILARQILDKALGALAAGAPKGQLEEWAERQQALPAGMCLACAEYHSQDVFCSVCSRVVESLVPGWRRGSKSDIFASVSFASMKEACGRDLFTPLDRAVQPVFLPPQLFSHLLLTLRRATVAPSPTELTRILFDLGHPMISAAQAAEVIEVLKSKGEVEFMMYHALCVCVVDQWNLSGTKHSIGACYYGYEGTDACKLLYPTDAQTLGAAIHQFMSRYTARSQFPQPGMPEFIRGLVRAHGVSRALAAHTVF